MKLNNDKDGYYKNEECKMSCNFVDYLVRFPFPKGKQFKYISYILTTYMRIIVIVSVEL